MKVFSLSYSDISGGAARAAYRIHRALRRHGVDSIMQVAHASVGDWSVQSSTSLLGKVTAKGKAFFGGFIMRLLTTGNPILHSPAIFPSHWPTTLNGSDADLLHMHWINGEMISVGDIGRLRKPVVWTLHDMWAFCGAEHYTEDSRWRDGYLRNNRPDHESGFDLNRWTWQRKRRAWQHPLHIVTPSRWLADCVRQSVLMRDWPVTVVHNAIDTDVWRPLDKITARGLLNLPCDVPLLLFGAMGGSNDPRKGFDLLKEALQLLRGQLSNLQLVVFGQLAPRHSEDLGFPVHYMGHLHDDLSLGVLYAAADAMVTPSRQDNLPNTGVEALACGRPVIAFNTCGLPDIVTHQKTGYLARSFDAEDLASGIQWVLEEPERHAELCTNARQDAVSRFSYPVIAEQYLRVYRAALDAYQN